MHVSDERGQHPGAFAREIGQRSDFVSLHYPLPSIFDTKVPIWCRSTTRSVKFADQAGDAGMTACGVTGLSPPSWTRRKKEPKETVLPIEPPSEASTGFLDTKRYRVTHRTEYRYSDVVTSSYGRGFLTPRDSLRQRCVAHEVIIDPAPADSSTSRDTYGNISSYFHVTQPHRTLTITSESIVEVYPPPPERWGSG